MMTRGPGGGTRPPTGPGLPVLAPEPRYELGGRQFTLDQWEAICTRCGDCCYEKVRTDGRVRATAVPCRFLREDRTCRVYDTRFQDCEGCVKVTPQAIRLGDLLPDDCPYVVLWRDLEEERFPDEPPARRR